MKTLQEMMAEAAQTQEFHVEYARIQFIEAVLEEMEKKDIRKKELADRAGMCRHLLSKVLKGKHSPTFTTAVRIARALGMRFSPELKKC